jgi:hypothetical protein
MDETTFQREIHQLKEQIGSMSTRFQYRQLPEPVHQMSPPPCDPFSDQMGDLQAHIMHLERRLEAARQGYRQSFSSQTTVAPQDMQPLPPTSYFHPTSNLELDKGAGMLYNDVACRLGYIQQTVSDMEDRFDRLDPNRFTPPASEATEDLGQHEGASNIHRAANTVASPSDQALGINNSQVGSSSAADLALQVKADAAKSAMVSLDFCMKQFALREEKLTVKEFTKFFKHLFNFNAQFLNYSRDALPAPTDMFEETASGPTGSHGTAELDAETDSYLPSGLPNLAPAQKESSFQIPAEGVAFRDQEIQRMDDQLIKAQECLHESEQRATVTGQALEELQARYNVLSHHYEQKTAATDELQAKYDALARRYAQSVVADGHKNRTLHTAQERITSRESLIRELRSTLSQKDQRIDELTEAHHVLEGNHDARITDLRTAKRHLAQLSRVLREFQKSKDEEIEQMISSRQDEIHRLQEFCEQKDGVIYQQEQIIARGARLLEDRDEEIEELSRRLKAVEDDREYELKQKLRFSKLLDERATELDEIKEGVARSCAVPVRCPSYANGDLRNPDQQLAVVTARLARCADILDVPGPDSYNLIELVRPDGVREFRSVHKTDKTKDQQLWWEPGYLGAQGDGGARWSPEPLKDNLRLPSEVVTASAWEKGERQ